MAPVGTCSTVVRADILVLSSVLGEDIQSRPFKYDVSYSFVFVFLVDALYQVEDIFFYS